MVEALRQRLDFDFERFHGVARQRLGELAADFGEVFAEAEMTFSRSLVGRSDSIRVVM